MAVLDHVEASLRSWPRNPCFIELNPKRTPKSITADQLLSHIETLSKKLETWGIRKGCLVPIFLGNSIDFVITFLGLLNLGAVPVLAKMEYRILELEEIFSNASPRAVIAESNHLKYLKDYVSDRTVILHEENNFQIVQQSNQMAQTESISSQIASINYTYRGYGYPIGAMIPQEQYIQGAKGFQECLLSNPGDKVLALLPMQHIYTLISAIFFPLLHHLTSIIIRTMHPRLIFEYIHRYKINFVTTVPEIFSMLYRLSDQSSPIATEVFVSGGSVLTPDAHHQIREGFGVEILNGYGLTECTPATGNIRGSAKVGTIGQPCCGAKIRINDANADGVGEIYINSRHMSREYYLRPKETEEGYSGEWLKTGDLGKAMGNHFVFIGEKKRTRKVNGNIVDLEEVKRALLRQQNVKDTEVSGESNAIKARITLNKPSRDFRKDWLSIRASVKGTIAEYKIPTIIENV
jgi:long-chain acyl-CoA synthetase